MEAVAEPHVHGNETKPTCARRVHHREVVLLLAPVVDRALVDRLDRERDQIRAVEQRDPVELERRSRRRRRRAARRRRGSAVFVPNSWLPSSSWIAIPNSRSSVRSVGVVRDAHRHRLVGQQPVAVDEQARDARSSTFVIRTRYVALDARSLGQRHRPRASAVRLVELVRARRRAASRGTSAPLRPAARR